MNGGFRIRKMYWLPIVARYIAEGSVKVGCHGYLFKLFPIGVTRNASTFLNGNLYKDLRIPALPGKV